MGTWCGQCMHQCHGACASSPEGERCLQPTSMTPGALPVVSELHQSERVASLPSSRGQAEVMAASGGRAGEGARRTSGDSLCSSRRATAANSCASKRRSTHGAKAAPPPLTAASMRRGSQSDSTRTRAVRPASTTRCKTFTNSIEV